MTDESCYFSAYCLWSSQTFISELISKSKRYSADFIACFSYQVCSLHIIWTHFFLFCHCYTFILDKRKLGMLNVKQSHPSWQHSCLSMPFECYAGRCCCDDGCLIGIKKSCSSTSDVLTGQKQICCWLLCSDIRRLCFLLCNLEQKTIVAYTLIMQTFRANIQYFVLWPSKRTEAAILTSLSEQWQKYDI